MIGEQFRIEGNWLDACPYGTGHINDTYAAKWVLNGKQKRFIHQRINHTVFSNPPQLMENILRVTSHLQRKLAAEPGSDPLRGSLTVIPTKNGASYYQDEQNNFWRTYVFIEDADTYDVCRDVQQAYQVALAFGRFQTALTDLPGGKLHETIPWFHHTPRRYQTLELAVSDDPMNRCPSAQAAIDFCLAHSSLVSMLTSPIERGEIPERITHNDTKINNVMIDNRTGRGICIIDLDTVMTGCALYDFGDMVRSLARTSAEDERDLSRVFMDIAAFEALVRGYLDGSRSFLTPVEIEYLPLAGVLLTFTIGIRFLTDYLLGDVYFKVHRPGHNLDRARVQFKMLESMEQQQAEMMSIVRKYL